MFPGSKLRSHLLCCAYRSPSRLPSQFYECLTAQCDRGALRCNQVITIIGDLNCNTLNPSLSQTKALLNFCNDLGFDQLVLEPTRITSESEARCYFD